MTQYTTYGNVCGPCGHKHATLAAAEQCRRLHSAAVSRYSANSYSDRNVVRVDARGEYLALTDEEADTLLDWQETQDVR